MQDPAAQFIHDINKQTHLLNKNIINETAGMKKVPLNKQIYSGNPASKVPVPQQPLNPQAVAQPQVPNIPPPNVPQNNIDENTAKDFIERLTSVEKKIDRFFNLIERRVVKNAKEINIRIKLNENTNTEQE